jgi:2-polyprenyl-6-methoxyphenol hydroxylase-like FAD-dependent oxidoreductase
MAPFKVGIVGGGLSGLTTALHLDKLGIDFFLLEKGDDIAPQVGASIGLFPNGLKILNQLGCYEEFSKVSVPIVKMTVRNGKGEPLYSHRILEGVSEKSGGYSVSFSERQLLLAILYRALSEEGKAKVFTGQRVTKLEEVKDGVRIHTAERTFDADIVVGSDGVHSFARSEMWRWAKEDGSDVFAGDMGDGESFSLFSFCLSLSLSLSFSLSLCLFHLIFSSSFTLGFLETKSAK